MTRDAALTEISQALAVLTLRIQADNQAGLYSINRIAEDILVPVLRIVFASPGLRNANIGSTVASDIDLEDAGTGLAIQVTSDRSAGKVTSTLEGFLKRGKHQTFTRLVMFVLSGSPPRPAKATKARWAAICGAHLRFDPTSDIISPTALLSLVMPLSTNDVEAIRKSLAHSIIGQDFVDVEAILAQQAATQLQVELKSTKYIPDVFVETLQIKYLARCFCHPTLFLERTLEGVNRLQLPWFDEQLAEASIAPLAISRLPTVRPYDLVSEAVADANSLRQVLFHAHGMLGPFTTLKGDQSPSPVEESKRYMFLARRYNLESGARRLRSRIDSRMEELDACRAQFFVLTGRAGQGKTNFICDFAESFLRKHCIPFAHLTGRSLRGTQGVDLAESIAHLILGPGVSFRDAATRLAEHADRRGTPFVLIIDGLNEHTHPDFAAHLEAFLHQVARTPQIRVLLTCRSEFFAARFGHVFTTVFAAETLVVTATPAHEHDERHAKLIDAYFAFFGIPPSRVARRVQAALVKDMLLLRFFCEAYGSRGKEPGYVVPAVWNIYRDHIFQVYLSRKLAAGGAALLLERKQTAAVAPEQPLTEVLLCIAKYMVDEWRFSDVPRDAVPAQLADALVVLLDEDVILREDLVPGPIFARPTEALNFTFDELRDYLVAQYLVSRVFPEDVAAFEARLASSSPETTQSLEGLKRFLFYAARRTGADAFGVYYRTHKWYGDVYDEEIFCIEGRLVDEADEAAVLQILEGGGYKAVRAARTLALNWYEDAHPRLNLALLLSFAHVANEQQYRDTFLRAFEAEYSGRPGLGANAVKFVHDEILPSFKPHASDAHDTLFRLLAVLLPLESNYNLESPAFAVLRSMGQRFPDFALEVVGWAFGSARTEVRPHLWRLLAYLAPYLPDTAALLTAAHQELLGVSPNSPLNREIMRFIGSAVHLNGEAP